MSIPELQNRIRQIADEISLKHAADVDKRARFPEEAFAALKEAGALGAAVPVELGGLGCDISQLTDMCNDLGQRCTSTAMILAMHHIQVACLVNHGRSSPEIENYLRTLVKEQRLIASGTSEVGPSGDMRQSVCFVQAQGDRFTIDKKCTTVSYGQMADDIFFQGRRNEGANAGDQVAILATRGTYTLEQLGSWDTLGMRGTCSPGGSLKVDGERWQLMETPFGEIATQTMVPYSHILWSGLWLGTAEDAVAKAGSVVRAKARKQPGVVPPAAQDLSRLTGKLQLMRANLKALVNEYRDLWAAGNTGELESLGFALRDNNLKLLSSELVVDIVADALRICGIMAYKNDSELSLGRHLRDAYSANLMINNQRIHATNASLLLVHKGQ